MIRYTNRKTVDSIKDGNKTTYLEYLEGYCNTSDTQSGLPTKNVANGSNLIDTDTGGWYFFNEKTQTWSKWRELKE